MRARLLLTPHIQVTELEQMQAQRAEKQAAHDAALREVAELKQQLARNEAAVQQAQQLAAQLAACTDEMGRSQAVLAGHASAATGMTAQLQLLQARLDDTEQQVCQLYARAEQ